MNATAEISDQSVSCARQRLRRKSFADDRYGSPWSLRERAGMLAWLVVERVLLRPTPKALNPWRLMWLRFFGCRISGTPFVHPAAKIKIPWQLTLEDRCAIGPGAEIYNLGEVILKRRCVISQYTYVCGGTHDLSSPSLPLLVGDIEVGEEAFVGARALLLPGIRVLEGSVVGAGSVVTSDTREWFVCAGSPCRPLKPRKWSLNSQETNGNVR